MKRILTFILIAALVITSALVFAACDENSNDVEETTVGDSCAHTDADDDKKCDKCGADFDDGAEPVTINCDFYVRYDDGTPIENLAFTLMGGKDMACLVSGEGGKINHSIKTGLYRVVFDEHEIPSGCLPEVEYVEITEDMTELVLVIIDNNPNGTLQKPFFISEDVTEFAIPAGAEYYYNYRGSSVKYLTVENESLSVIYDGKEYAAVDGVVSVTIAPQQIGSMTLFAIKNNSGEEITGSFSLKSPEGSMDNPIAFEGGKIDVNVPAESAIYYAWTADKDGVVIVSSESEINNISLVNVNTNLVSSASSGAYATYMSVSEGDVIRIEVSSTKNSEDAVIDVALNCYAGTEEEPVPVVMERVELAFGHEAEYVFSAAVGKVITLEDPEAAIFFDGKYYSPTSIVSVEITLEGEGETVLFTVINGAIGVNGIAFDVQ